MASGAAVTGLALPLQAHSEEAAGDILVFLTGQDEIESVDRLLADRAAQMLPSPSCGLRLAVVSIYASMPPEQQMKVTAESGGIWAQVSGWPESARLDLGVCPWK